MVRRAMANKKLSMPHHPFVGQRLRSLNEVTGVGGRLEVHTTRDFGNTCTKNLSQNRFLAGTSGYFEWF